jgi:hypothetical protein
MAPAAGIHQLTDLHETHALRAVLTALLTASSAGEVADILAALPELAGPGQRERRGRIGYWLADLYPGEPLLASLGPDLLVEKFLDTAAVTAAGLEQVITAVQRHGAAASRHRSRLLGVLQLAADSRPAVHSALHRYLASPESVSPIRSADADPEAKAARIARSAQSSLG